MKGVFSSFADLFKNSFVYGGFYYYGVKFPVGKTKKNVKRKKENCDVREYNITIILRLRVDLIQWICVYHDVTRNVVSEN